ncbi:MAG: nitrous oxide reductase accessory protein NosL [Desulfomonilaceae bacterium]
MKKTFRRLTIMVFVTIFVGIAGQVSAFANKIVELPDGSKIPVPTSCAVCGMKIQDETDIHGALVFSSGKVVPFDSISELFRYSLSPDTFGFKPADLKKAFVVDHDSKKFVEAKDAVYVIGSDSQGMMGPEMHAFSNKSSAEKFVADAKDKKILVFSQVSLQDVGSKKKTLKMKH